MIVFGELPLPVPLLEQYRLNMSITSDPPHLSHVISSWGPKSAGVHVLSVLLESLLLFTPNRCKLAIVNELLDSSALALNWIRIK